MCIVLYIHRSAKFGVVVFKASMFFEGEGSASRSDYICKVWCSGIQGIYAQLQGAICHGYMCIVLYMKLIWCNGFAEIYAQLEGSGESICHRYMCILLYIYIYIDLP